MPVQTPQIRSVNAQASRGSRPLRMTSRPRHIVPVDTQVPLDPGNRIDDDPLARIVQLEALSFVAHVCLPSSFGLLLRALLSADAAACITTPAPVTAATVPPTSAR